VSCRLPCVLYWDFAGRLPAGLQATLHSMSAIRFAQRLLSALAMAMPAHLSTQMPGSLP